MNELTQEIIFRLDQLASEAESYVKKEREKIEAEFLKKTEKKWQKEHPDMDFTPGWILQSGGLYRSKEGRVLKRNEEYAEWLRSRAKGLSEWLTRDWDPVNPEGLRKYLESNYNLLRNDGLSSEGIPRMLTIDDLKAISQFSHHGMVSAELAAYNVVDELVSKTAHAA